jgi:hypothetical protein
MNTPEIFGAIKKILSAEGGSFIIMAAPVTGIVKKVFNLIYENAAEKDIYMPVVLFGCCLIMYGFVTFADFVSGLAASRKEALKEKGTTKGYVKADKLWGTVWKLQGVLMISGLLVFFSYVFLAIEWNNTAGIFQFAIPLFFIVVILFDIKSIGENHLRSYGKKPSFYLFMDDISMAVREGIIERLKRTLR